MRTLKKTLCLVLCLVMMAGLCVIGANAAYTDESKIESKYKEAVDVLSMIKVIEGYPTGDYKPQGNLTRAEAAAIMTRLLAVKEEGPKTSSFTDMAAAAWAQPYVAYCEAAGIIAGVGGGKFAPGEKLTTAQFAKMLLCALGFDAEREGLVGNSWEINTVKLVNTIDMADKLEVITWAENEYITREQAAQMAFNALITPMVEYDANGVYFLKDGTPTNPRNNIRNNAYDYHSNGTTIDKDEADNLMEFCEYHFPTLKVMFDVDDFDLPCNYWFFGKDSEDYKYSDAKLGCKAIVYEYVLAVYAENAAEITGKQLYKDAAASGASVDISVYVNGGYDGFVTAEKNGKDYVLFDNGMAGATSYLIDSDLDGEGDYLAVKAPFLAKVTGVTEGEDRTVSIEAYVSKDGKKNAASFESDEFERGDYILVYAKDFDPAFTDEDVIEAELAETAAGKLTKINLVAGVQSSAVTLDKVRYPAGSEDLALLGPVEKKPVYTDKEDYNLGDGYTAFLSNGYVIGIVGDAIVFADAVYLVKADVPATPGAYSTYYGAYASDKGFLAGYVDLEGKGAETVIPETAGPIAEHSDGATWYKNSTLKSALTKYCPGKIAITTLDPKTPALGDEYGYVVTNDATIFILRTGTQKFERYEGIKNVPTYTKLDTYKYDATAGKFTTSGTGTYVYADAIVNSGFAVAVYIDLRGIKADTAAATASDPIFVIGKALTKEFDDDGEIVYTYNVIKDGKKDTIKVLDGVELPAGALVAPYYDAKGRVKAYEAAKAEYFGPGDVDFMENTVKLGGVRDDGLTPYTMAYAVLPDANCFIITGDPATPTVKITKGTPSSLTYNYGEVIMVFNKAGKVTELYFLPETRPAVT